MIAEPEIGLLRFNCPHCGAFAQQTWYVGGARNVPGGVTASEYLRQRRSYAGDTLAANESDAAEPYLIKTMQAATRGDVFLYVPLALRRLDYSIEAGNLSFSRCESCWDVGVWIADALAWPIAQSAPLPNPDLPDSVRNDYIEAGTIVVSSPRGAAALLRLAIQKLCNEATGKEQDIAKSIAELEAKGLSRHVVDALHIVRVVGNEAVHPGTLDLGDDPAIAHRLFELVNRIADALISQPKRDQELWDKLPATKRADIENKRATKADHQSKKSDT